MVRITSLTVEKVSFFHLKFSWDELVAVQMKKQDLEPPSAIQEIAN